MIIWFLFVFVGVFKWVICGLNVFGNGVVWLFGFKVVIGYYIVYLEEEICMIVSVLSQEGVLEDSEKEFVYNVFDLFDIIVCEVMCLCVDMVMVDSVLLLCCLFEFNDEYGYLWVLVYQDIGDNIVGIVYIGDVLCYFGEFDYFIIVDIMCLVFFVFEVMKIKDLFVKMCVKKLYMSIVVDEFGGIMGLVMFEDVIEEIVGEIYDEIVEEEEQFIIVIVEGIYLMDVSLIVYEVEEWLGSNFEDGEVEYDMLVGFMISYFGDIFEVGQSFVYGGWLFMVEEVDQCWVMWVWVECVFDVDFFDIFIELFCD